MPALANSNSPRFRFILNSDLLGPLVLSTDPVGWDRIGVSLHRDTLRHGLTTEYSAELGFVKQGRAYLMRAYDAAGIEADVRLRVEQLDPNEFAWRPYYSGRVNLTTRQLTDIEFRANVENENFIQKFLNREAVAVDLLGNTSVGGSTVRTVSPLTVELHSRALIKRFTAAVGTVAKPDPLTFTGLLFGSDPLQDELSMLFYFGYNTAENSGYLNELGLQQIAGGFVSGDSYAAVPIFHVPDHGEYAIELGGVIDLEVRYTRTGSNAYYGYFGQVDVKFHYRINGDPTSAVVLASGQDSGFNSSPHNYARRFTIAPQKFTEQLKEGDKIYLYAEIYTHEVRIESDTRSYQFELRAAEQPGTYLRIRATTQTAPTPCTGLLIYEVLDRLATALTDEPFALRSSYFGRPDSREPQPFDGAGALLLLTGGFQLRGFPLPSAPAPLAGATDTRKSIYATWRDLWDSLSAIYGLGYSVELNAAGKPVIRVEPLSYFYPATVVLDLTVGTADRPAPRMAITTKEVASRYFQSLEFGYDAWRAEQVNGLDEVNTKRQWTTPLTQVSTTYSQVSKYATSGQLLEVTRRQRYEESATTDNGRDNANFFVALLRRPPSVVPASFETERNQLFARLEGVLDPASIYNARLTPARNLRRHGAVVRAGLEPAGNRLVRFTFGEGNNEMVSQLVGEAAPVTEKADIRVSELAPPLWRPVVDSFKAPISRQQLQTLLANPLGRVRYFDAGRKVREGWILDFTHESDQGLGSFELLPCAD